MNQQTIARDTWPTFGVAFSRQHQGWLATIDRGRDVVAEMEPLHDVRISGHDAEIRVGTDDDLKSYKVRDLTAVRVIAADERGTAIQRVELVGSDETLALQFRTVIAPELVDGAG